MRLWLKIKIISLYGSQTDFAQAIKKRDDWLSRVITGRIDPDQAMMEIIASKLKVEDVESLFLKQKIQKAA